MFCKKNKIQTMAQQKKNSQDLCLEIISPMLARKNIYVFLNFYFCFFLKNFFNSFLHFQCHEFGFLFFFLAILAFLQVLWIKPKMLRKRLLFMFVLQLGIFYCFFPKTLVNVLRFLLKKSWKLNGEYKYESLFVDIVQKFI